MGPVAEEKRRPLDVKGEITIQSVFYRDNRSAMPSLHGRGMVSANCDTFESLYDRHATVYASGSTSVSTDQLRASVPGTGLAVADVGHLLFNTTENLALDVGRHDLIVGASETNCSNHYAYFT